jgi:heme-degrading monooxygenase HmoA
MLCALSVRRLMPGSYEDFRRAWEPEEFPEGFTRAYHLRNLNDENQVVSFGFYDGTLEDLERIRDQQKEEERQSRMAEFVESTDVDAIFEVVDEVTPPAS